MASGIPLARGALLGDVGVGRTTDGVGADTGTTTDGVGAETGTTTDGVGADTGTTADGVGADTGAALVAAMATAACVDMFGCEEREGGF